MEALLSEVIELTDADSKTTRILPFLVPEGLCALTAKLSYAPGALEDEHRARELLLPALRRAGEREESWRDYLPISNLITLSLDDPHGYRGNAHRGELQQTHTLAEEAASRGFYAGPILAGGWKAQIHIHSLVTGHCRVRLEITGE